VNKIVQNRVGVTGSIGCGKSYTSKKLKRLARKRGLESYRIDLDEVGHYILSAESPYQGTRELLVDTFGRRVAANDGSINRRNLGRKVFGNREELNKLNQIMQHPIASELEVQLGYKDGLFFIEGAVIPETDAGELCDYNFLLVDSNRESVYRRLRERPNHDDREIDKRIRSQLSLFEKRIKLERMIEEVGYGNIWVIDNSDNTENRVYELMLNQIIEDLEIVK